MQSTRFVILTMIWLVASGLVLAQTTEIAPTEQLRLQTDKTLLHDVDQSAGVPIQHSDQWIGVLCRPVDAVLRQHLQLPDEVGLVVEQVVPNSPAESVGLQARDILTHLDGEPLTTLDQLIAKTAGANEAGIRLSWIRNGKVQMDGATVHPQKRPAGVAAFRTDMQGDEQAPDANRLRAWVDQLQGGEILNEGKPFQFRFFGPGVTLPPDGQNSPIQLSIEIERKNDEPARIKVTKDGTTWDITENDLDQLPEDVRGAVQNGLGRGGQGWMIPPDRMPWPKMDERFEDINRRMEKMFEELHELRKDRANEDDEPMDA